MNIDQKNKNTLTIENELKALNYEFHNKNLLSDCFYNQLEQEGFNYAKSILISIFPDSSNTYCGTIIKQDGSVFDIDIDLDSPEFSTWKNITKEFIENLKNSDKFKKKSVESIAYCLFEEKEET